MVKWVGGAPGGYQVPPPASLDGLHGPAATAGEVTLPVSLCGPAAWKRYRLDSRTDACLWVERVLRYATRPEDHQDYLSADLLYRTWPLLALPPAVREQWEAAHPELEG